MMIYCIIFYIKTYHIWLDFWIFGKFPKFPYRGSNFSKVGNFGGNFNFPSGNWLDLDLVTLVGLTVSSVSRNGEFSQFWGFWRPGGEENFMGNPHPNCGEFCPCTWWSKFCYKSCILPLKPYICVNFGLVITCVSC